MTTQIETTKGHILAVKQCNNLVDLEDFLKFVENDTHFFEDKDVSRKPDG